MSLSYLVNNYYSVKENIATWQKKYSCGPVELLIASKHLTETEINYIIEKTGHNLFGENRVQDSMVKWPRLLVQYPQVRLHFIGHLQSNKIKNVIELFHTIESVGSIKLAEKIYRQAKLIKRNVPAIFLQINIGREQQKTGFYPEEMLKAYNNLKERFTIKGIMCIPPQDAPAFIYFAKMQLLAKTNNIKHLSMGMSSDYKTAIKFGATQIRIGSVFKVVKIMS